MKSEDLKLPSYGGQALIEGVLMRGSNSLAVAMRSPENEIVVETEELSGIYQSKIKNIPFLRGLILLWDALVLGMRWLTVSANLQTGEDEKIEGPMLYLTLIGSFAIAMVLFFLTPAAIGQWVEHLLGLNTLFSNLLEGIIRLLLVIGYIWGVGFMPDIERVFAYHGAEHKTINAFEAGDELTPENVSKHSREHPRCGTSFILTLVLISVIVFALFGQQTLLWRLLTRVLLLPVIAGISYEYIKWVSNNIDKSIPKLLIRPNLALQKLTTREPSLDIIAVGIASFNAMISKENEYTENDVINPQEFATPTASDEVDYQNQ